MTADPATFDDIIAWTWDGPPRGSAAAAQARLLLLDSLGCALAGLRHPRPAAFGVALSGGFAGDVRLPGVVSGLAPGAAAALLATAMCWDEANDGLARAHGRPGLPVAPLALVALATQRARLGEALAAFAIGYEVAGRAGELWRIRSGMHVDGSWHALGAAAAAARLAGLDATGVARAVRLAACQVPFSLYAPIAAGMDGRNLYPAHAVLLGEACAASAAAGMEAPSDGFAQGRRIALGAVDAGGRAPAGEWLLEEGYVKPYAGVRHAHYGAAAAIALRPRVRSMEAIRGILLETYGEAITYAGNRAPASAIKAQFSLSWAVAAALAQGDLGPEAYTDAALADPLLRRLEAMVELREDLGMTAAGRRAARVTLDLGGERISEAAEGVAGDPARPMLQDEVLAKFLRLAGPLLGPSARETAGTILEGSPGASVRPFG